MIKCRLIYENSSKKSRFLCAPKWLRYGFRLTVNLPAHKHTGDYIDESTEEAAVLALVEEETDPVNLSGGDDEHDHPDKDGEVAVGLAGPIHHELPVLLPPFAGGEQQAVALEYRLRLQFLAFPHLSQHLPPTHMVAMVYHLSYHKIMTMTRTNLCNVETAEIMFYLHYENNLTLTMPMILDL